MSLIPSRQTSNARLGLYFGIITSMFVASVLVLVVLEQLGIAQDVLRVAMVTVLMALMVAVGASVPSNDLHEMFASGRRVPSVYNGLCIAVPALGGVGLVSLCGALFLRGFDMLVLTSGWCAGLVVMAVLIAPFLRKAGCFTLPSYLGRRFQSAAVRSASAVLMSVPLLLLLTAELLLAGRLLTQLAEVPTWLAHGVLLAIVTGAVIVGGMRSATWAVSAMAVCALLALLVPIAVLGTLETNLPLPQFSQGPTLRMLMRLDQASGIGGTLAPHLAFSLPGTELQPIHGSLTVPFDTIGPAAYVLVSLTIMAGIAVSPVLLSRAGTTLGVYEARKSLGWASLIMGTLLLTMVVAAVFMRDRVLVDLLAAGRDQLPDWFRAAEKAGLAAIAGPDSQWTVRHLNFHRDAVLALLPSASEFPVVATHLLVTGALAAALAAMAQTVVVVAGIWAEDLLAGFQHDPPADTARVMAMRGGMLAAAAVAWLATAIAPGDPLALTIWAIVLTGATLFPTVTLSIWWKRTTATTALASMLSGFAVTIVLLVVGPKASFGIDGALAGAIGLAVSTIVALAAGSMTARPRRSDLEMVYDIRVPGGETVYDRELRHQRLKRMREP